MRSSDHEVPWFEVIRNTKQTHTVNKCFHVRAVVLIKGLRALSFFRTWCQFCESCSCTMWLTTHSSNWLQAPIKVSAVANIIISPGRFRILHKPKTHEYWGTWWLFFAWVLIIGYGATPTIKPDLGLVGVKCLAQGYVVTQLESNPLS